MLSKLEIQALLRACQKQSGVLGRTKTAESLAQTLGFGRVAGRRWLLENHDRERIRDYLRNNEKIDPDTPASAWGGLNRIEATHLGSNEKLAGHRPREGRLALRANGALLIGGREIELPPQAYLDLKVSSDTAIGHDAVIVVENFVAFVHYEDASIETPYQRPLLLYRGDAINPPDSVLQFLRDRKLPIACWPDFDPAGMQIAAALPNCAGIVAPVEPERALRELGREDLFSVQLRELEMLSLTNESAALESALRNCRCGLEQERMIARGTPQRLWRM